jgi:hypothetical protein
MFQLSTRQLRIYLQAKAGLLMVSYSLGECISMNPEVGGGSDQVPVIAAHDFSDEASLELFHGLRKQNAFLHHFLAEDLKALFESDRRFDFTLTHAVFLF